MSKMDFKPLTPARWSDLENLFGSKGACGGCWCMWWRISPSAFERQKGDQNKRAFEQIVKSGEPTGIVAYVASQPVAWCAVAPREVYAKLGRSRVLKPVDQRAVWSITCLFVERAYRRQGVTVELLKAAVDHVRQLGGKLVEGYPVEPKSGQIPDAFAYTGLASAFRKAGFVEALRRSETRPIMRFEIGGLAARRPGKK